MFAQKETTATPQDESAHPASRFIHNSGIDQRYFLQVSRIAVRAAHIELTPMLWKPYQQALRGWGTFGKCPVYRTVNCIGLICDQEKQETGKRATERDYEK
jgi:hypothetical protein